MKRMEFGTENREVVLLLHGGGLSWWNYRQEAELLGSRFHVVLPILDGHAGSDAPFESIEAAAARLIDLIDREYGGSVLVLGGLSLGAQIVTQMLSIRPEICRYAVIESALAIPSKLTQALIGPSVKASYGLIRKRWFARLQFRSLRLREDLFEDYYRDTADIARDDMIAFLRSNAAYAPKEGLQNCRAAVRIVVGGKEQRRMLRSAQLLQQLLPESRLEIKPGLYHGEYAVNRPEEYVRELLQMLDG